MGQEGAGFPGNGKHSPWVPYPPYTWAQGRPTAARCLRDTFYVRPCGGMPLVQGHAARLPTRCLVSLTFFCGGRNPAEFRGILWANGNIPVCPWLCSNERVWLAAHARGSPAGVDGQSKDNEFQVVGQRDQAWGLRGLSSRCPQTCPALVTTLTPRVPRHNEWGPVWIQATENRNWPWEFGDRKCSVALAGFWRRKQGRLCPWGIVTRATELFWGRGHCRLWGGRILSLPHCPSQSPDSHLRGVHTVCI